MYSRKKHAMLIDLAKLNPIMVDTASYMHAARHTNMKHSQNNYQLSY